MSNSCCSHCRSPRRQRPMTSAPAAQPAMTGSITLFALPRPTLAGTSLPLSHEGQMFSRRGTLRSASVSSAPASSAPHARADTPMPSAQPGASLPLLHSSDPLVNDRVSILRSAGAQLPCIKWHSRTRWCCIAGVLSVTQDGLIWDVSRLRLFQHVTQQLGVCVETSIACECKMQGTRSSGHVLQCAPCRRWPHASNRGRSRRCGCSAVPPPKSPEMRVPHPAGNTWGTQRGHGCAHGGPLGVTGHPHLPPQQQSWRIRGAPPLATSGGNRTAGRTRCATGPAGGSVARLVRCMTPCFRSTSPI